MSSSFSIAPLGTFSLEAAAGFTFGQRTGTPDQQVMRMAFALDGFVEPAGVVLRQDGEGLVHAEVHGTSDADALRDQVARILSLDHDGRSWLHVGEGDAVIARLQRDYPGQRPVLYHSPYECAAWCVLSARTPRRQAANARAKICRQLGVTFQLAGQELTAFPLPQRLLKLTGVAGVSAEKVQRLHGVAQAAIDGLLDATRLRAMDPDDAKAQVAELRGIGPFSATLIVNRSSGHADAQPNDEKRILSYAAHYYGRGATPSYREFLVLAERWRPFRTWAVVLMRLAGDRAGLGPGPTGPRHRPTRT